MTTYFSNLIPRIQQYSQKLDSLTLLINQHWVCINNISNTRIVYIFHLNNDLIISNNGNAYVGKWEYLGNNSLLIEAKSGSFLVQHVFFDDKIFAFKVDSKDEYSVFVNENKTKGEINSLDKAIGFLKNKYIDGNLNNRDTIKYYDPISGKTSKDDTSWRAIGWFFAVVILFLFIVFMFR